MLLGDAKYDACDTALRYLASYFPKPATKRPDQRHPDRPGELHILDVLADDLAIGWVEAFEPLADRFSA